MDKGIGFNRTVYRSWLDAAAAFAAERGSAADMRARLATVVGQEVQGVDARRKTIDVLINIWLKNQAIAPDLYAYALDWFRTTQVAGDRLWLHYGLTLLYYAFFRECAAAIGQFSRIEDVLTRKMVKERLASERGHLGSLDRSVERVMASLLNWGALTATAQRHVYVPARQAFVASSIDLESWLLACALTAHSAEELPFADLIHLPELFPFRFAVGIDALRAHRWFAVQRQGGWDMVRVIADKPKRNGTTQPTLAKGEQPSQG